MQNCNTNEYTKTQEKGRNRLRMFMCVNEELRDLRTGSLSFVASSLKNIVENLDFSDFFYGGKPCLMISLVLETLYLIVLKRKSH